MCCACVELTKGLKSTGSFSGPRKSSTRIRERELVARNIMLKKKRSNEQKIEILHINYCNNIVRTGFGFFQVFTKEGA